MQPANQPTTITTSSSSIYEIIGQIELNRYFIPEFQRKFVWDLDRCTKLFDSLITKVFIGNIVLGPPDFGISVREFDNRPRTGRGSGRTLNSHHITHDDFIRARNDGTPKLLILDGQQRLTALYRGLLGIDELYYVAKPIAEPYQRDLEGWFEEVTTSPDNVNISIKLSDIYALKDIYGPPKMEMTDQFLRNMNVYAIAETDDERNNIITIGHQIVGYLERFFNDNRVCTQTKIETNLEMFVKYFERSNSTPFTLSFVDIIVAKIFVQYKLRPVLERVKETSSARQIKYSNSVDENLVRMVAWLSGIPLSKRRMLNGVTGHHFETHFNTARDCYFGMIQWLRSNNLIYETTDIPYPNMIVPLMAFLSRVRNNDVANITQNQCETLIEWYFRSGMTERYSKKAGEVLNHDVEALSELGLNPDANIFTDEYRLTFAPSRIQSREDLVHFSSTSGSIPKTSRNLVNYLAEGTYSLRDNSRVMPPQKVDKHHIFPKQFILDQRGDQDLINSLMNYVNISRTTNIQISSRAPEDYFLELSNDNEEIDNLLQRLNIPLNIKNIVDASELESFLFERTELIWNDIVGYLRF